MDDDDDDRDTCGKRRLPSLFAWFLLLSASGTYFILVIPNLQDLIGDSLIHLIDTFYLFLLIYTSHGILFLYVIVNYLLATCMDPGKFPKVNTQEVIENINASTQYKTISINDISVRMKWCTTCQFYRPPRSSHCAICDYCIDTMDHHCPWLSNCVGKRNYRYFLQFLISLTLHMTLILTVSITMIYYNSNNLSTTPVIASLVLMILISILLIPIGGLTGFHLILVSRGRTTNEQVTGKFRSGVNPFDLGCVRNWSLVMCTTIVPSMLKTRLNHKYTQQKLNAFNKPTNSSSTFKHTSNANKKIEVNINIIKETRQQNHKLRDEIELPIRGLTNTRQQSISSNATDTSYEQKRLIKSSTQQKRFSNHQNIDDDNDDEQDYDDVYEIEAHKQSQVWIDRKAQAHSPTLLNASRPKQFNNDLKKFLDNSSLSSTNTDRPLVGSTNAYIRNDSYYNANRQQQQQQQHHTRVASQQTKKTIGQPPKEQQQIPTTQDYASYEITV